MVDMTGVKGANRDARNYLAQEGNLLVTAGALLTESIYAKMLGNIFLAINQPKIPARLFSDKAAAIKWLKKYL
jgi:hypothetical protein